jgi:Type VI secretion system/phage-baseplate injector OB domain
MKDDRVYGKYRAIVTDNVDPQRLLRVQVDVPELAVGGAWALPCLPPGVARVPEAGSAVWVEFEQGDPSSPIWSGCFWTGEAPPPEAK